VVRGRTEYAYTKVGIAKQLRTWNIKAKKWAWTPAGLNYYKHNRRRFIINVPCLGYIPRQHTRRAGDPEDDVLLRATFFGQHQLERYIPLTEETLADFSEVPAQVHRLTAVGLVHDGVPEDEILDRLRRLVLMLLANAPTVRTVDGVKHKISIESVIIWVWNALMTITFDEQVVSEDDGQPEVEVILDRPLRGEPYMDEQMYCRQGLCSIACTDLADRDGCIVAQIGDGDS
jgi:hypothetical protein